MHHEACEGEGERRCPLKPNGTLLRADGTQCHVWPKKRKFSLDELQKLVGGYIERVEIGPGLDMIVDEEGRLKGLPQNAEATLLAGRLIVGNAFVLARRLW